MELYFQKCNAQAILPKRATPQSAGFDLSACLSEPIILSPGQRALIPTGLCAAPKSDTAVALLLYARSGLAIKHGITMANAVGVIDADYRGEICVPLINLGTEPFTVTHGMRIAQLIVTPVLLPDILEADTLSATQRGTGGFGSTGL